MTEQSPSRNCPRHTHATRDGGSFVLPAKKAEPEKKPKKGEGKTDVATERSGDNADA